MAAADPRDGEDAGPRTEVMKRGSSRAGPGVFAEEVSAQKNLR
jgi:hypothetical protein